MTISYLIKRVPAQGPTAAHWDASLWSLADSLSIDQFHPRSSDHHPQTQVRALRDGANLYLRFAVDDLYVRATATAYQQSVCLDSCVEFFVAPKPGQGYFNFEINCGGTLLLYYVEDPTRSPEGLAKFTPVSPALAQTLTILHSLPKRIDPERTEPLRWFVTCRIPLALLEAYVGPLGTLSGQTWRGNFYKCADKTSHPHWGSWAPIGENLNFHQPHFFGELRFDA